MQKKKLVLKIRSFWDEFIFNTDFSLIKFTDQKRFACQLNKYGSISDIQFQLCRVE